MEMRDRAGRRREGARILRVDAAFDGMAGEAHFVLRYRQAATRSDANLLVHEVDAGDRFGHGMLDLKAGVHLDEIELAILVEKFDGTGA